MKKKRKYTRKVEECKGSLPSSIQNDIESIIKYRKILGLFDDSRERTERALRYQEFINGRR